MINTIITDFDGTLVDTFEANFRAYEKAFSEEGLSISLDEYREIYGMRFDDFMRTVGIVNADVAKRIRDLKTLYYPEFFDKIVPNRKLIDELVNFRKTGGKTAIASTARKENLMNVLEYFQLGELFDLIYSADDVNKGKPNPEIYLKTMQQLGVTPEETLIYEDSEVGVQAAAASGAKFARVNKEWFER